MSRRVSGRALSAASSRLETLDTTSDFAKIFCSELLGKYPGGSGPYKAKWDYLRSEILSKYCRPSPEDAQQRVKLAVEKLLGSESRCKQINTEGFNDPLWPSIATSAQRIIARVLGDIGDLFKEYETTYSFPHGATTCFRRSSADPYWRFHPNKVSDVTSGAFRYATYLRKTTPRWRDTKFNVISGNTVFTVPKSTDIDRAACKEPGLNQSLQRTVGTFIRRRLKKVVGIDLKDQSRNRNLARRGSATNRLATLDLSSASDSISCRLVDELLPIHWSEYLNQIRSPFGTLPDGSVVCWEKHSTMGNGYTFELESLLFYALAISAIEVERAYAGRLPLGPLKQVVSVYGDDIIVPSHYYSCVVHALRVAGFTTNEKKSFCDGPFRESCGGHYWNGHDIKPFYIRTPVNNVSRIIWLLNALRSWASDDDGWCDPSVYDLWLKYKRKFVPKYFWGGSNVDSVTSLATPEEPRFCISERRAEKCVVGYPALLRSFSMSLAERPQYGSEATSHATDCSFNRVVLPTYLPTGAIPNKELMVNFPMFPHEAVKLCDGPILNRYKDY